MRVDLKLGVNAKKSERMIRLLYIECGVTVQNDWMNGVDRLQRAFVWYDGAHFWIEQGDNLPIPQKGESRWVESHVFESGQFKAAEQVPVRWNATLRQQMSGYRLKQTGEEVWSVTC